MGRTGAIGLYDSGVGGLTVASRIKAALPGETMLYIADTARVPYGDRTRDEIIRFAREIMGFLQSQGVRAIVVACNTSSSIALPVVSPEFGIPITGMVDPAARAAAAATRSGIIGVIGTANTIRSGSYVRAIQSINKSYLVFGQACPELVPMAERGEVRGREVRETIRHYVEPLIDRGVDTLVYGCTHYPFFHDEVCALVGSGIAIVDPAGQVALEVVAAIGERNGERGQLKCLVTGNPKDFARVAASLVGHVFPELQEGNAVVGIEGFDRRELYRDTTGSMDMIWGEGIGHRQSSGRQTS